MSSETKTSPKHSARAEAALAVLKSGGQFRYGLERNSYTGREQFKARLMDAAGQYVRGVGGATFNELRGLLQMTYSTSVASYYSAEVSQ